MDRLGRKTTKKLASLSALGAGALALGPKAAEAGVLYNATPVTLTHTGGGPTVTWNTGDGGSLALPGAAKFGFSMYDCGCGSHIGVGLVPNLLAAAFGYRSTLHSGSYPFLKLVSAGARTSSYRVPSLLAIASFKSVSSNLLSGGDRQFQNKFFLFSFFNTANSSTNFGWAELSLSANPNPLTETLTIEGYAFDDSGARLAAGEVPEPGTFASTAFAALALGAAGLRRWRAARRKTA